MLDNLGRCFKYENYLLSNLQNYEWSGGGVKFIMNMMVEVIDS